MVQRNQFANSGKEFAGIFTLHLLRLIAAGQQHKLYIIFTSAGKIRNHFFAIFHQIAAQNGIKCQTETSVQEASMFCLLKFTLLLLSPQFQSCGRNFSPMKIQKVKIATVMPPMVSTGASSKSEIAYSASDISGAVR